MRVLILCGALLAAGCHTSIKTRDVDPMGEPDDGVSSSEKMAASARWVEELAMEGVRPENQAGHTMFLIRKLKEYRPQSTTVVLERGVRHRNAKVRENAAYFLGFAAEAGAEEALMNMLEDSAPAVQYSAAASLLLGYREEAGVRLLVDAMRSEELGHRREGVRALRSHFKQYFAFSPNGPRAEREFSIQKWEEFLR